MGWDTAVFVGVCLFGHVQSYLQKKEGLTESEAYNHMLDYAKSLRERLNKEEGWALMQRIVDDLIDAKQSN